MRERTLLPLKLPKAQISQRNKDITFRLLRSDSRFPNVSHQVQILPSTHIFRPIHHIRKSPPCLSAKITP